jgi:hypothetical protein
MVISFYSAVKLQNAIDIGTLTAAFFGAIIFIEDNIHP